MTRNLLAALTIQSILGLASPMVLAGDLEPGLLTTFDADTDGWTQGANSTNPVTWMADGGPLGAGDGFIVVTGNGIDEAAGGKLSVKRGPSGDFWAGSDYIAHKIERIRMDVQNISGTAGLELRFQLETSNVDWAVTSVGQPLNLSGWQTIEFDVRPTALTTTGDASALLMSQTAVRIFHSTVATASQNSDEIAAQIGIDNIQALGPPPLLNEIRTADPGTGDQEYFEVRGTKGESLDGVTLVVLGDNDTAGDYGIIEEVVSLDGVTIRENRHALIAEGSFNLAAETPDRVTTLNFEDSDNITFVLVKGFTGADGDDLDTDDDGTLDATPWADEFDRIALVEVANTALAAGDEWAYGPPSVGPDGSSAPAHVSRCPGLAAGWRIHDADPANGGDTPATFNDCGCTSAGDCDDADMCTDDACETVNGDCTHALIDCVDSVACTVDGCDINTGCTNVATDALCDDSVDCTVDACNPATGCVFAPTDANCDDGNACTADSCDSMNGCANIDTSADCDDDNPCTVDSCAPASGCVNVGMDCDDENACTADSCTLADGCVNADITASCDDNDLCTTDSCDTTSGCVNTDNSAACADTSECTTDSCDPISGCMNVDNSASCDDDDACTADSCVPATGCVNSDTSASCDDSDPCTVDACDKALGCTHSADTSECGTCGDGIKQPDEACDESGANTATCDSDCTTPECGDSLTNTAVGETCDDGNTDDDDGCDSNCNATGCGNGIVTSNEACDDGNTDDGDGCDSNCTTTGCGNGITTSGEECDAGAVNSDTVADACRSDCTDARCGDGVTDTGEGCDDGNNAGGDGCDAACVAESCGDGVVQAGEDCDDAAESATCNANCTDHVCPDTVLNLAAGETCDDGFGSDICDNDCTPVECGDQTVNAVAGEECDTGTASLSDTAADACRTDCMEPRCGDSVVDTAEACDDGNTDSNDGCSAGCQVESCGDGVTQSSEACDDSGESASCNADCTEARCGDALVNATAGETCDESGPTTTCDADCTPPICGDGNLNQAAGEACDDGNVDNGDGCNDECQVSSGENAAGGDGCTGGSSPASPMALLIVGLVLAARTRHRRKKKVHLGA